MSIGCIGIGDWKPGDCIPGLAITRSGGLHLGKGVVSSVAKSISRRSQPDGDAGTLGTFRPLRDRYHASTPSFRAYEVFELTRSAPGSILTQPAGQRVILGGHLGSYSGESETDRDRLPWWRKAALLCRRPTASHRATHGTHLGHRSDTSRVSRTSSKRPTHPGSRVRFHEKPPRVSPHRPAPLPPPLISD